MGNSEVVDTGAGIFIKKEPSRLIHSSSVPVIRKRSTEATDTKCDETTNGGGILFVAPGSMETTATTKGLEPIKEEQHSVAKKRGRSFTRKSRSSEV